MTELFKTPFSLIIILFFSIVIILLALVLYNFYTAKKELLKTVQALNQEIEHNNRIILSLNVEKDSLEKDKAMLDLNHQDLIVKFNELNKLKENAYSNIRTLEIEISNLQNELREMQNPNFLSRSGIYQTSEEEMAKRIKEAVEPWIIRVHKLESEFDLYKINESSEIMNKNDSSAYLKQVKEDIEALKQSLNMKEEENIKLRLNLNKVIVAYNDLKSSSKR